MSLLGIIGILLVIFGAVEIFHGALLFGIIVIVVGLFVAGRLAL